MINRRASLTSSNRSFLVAAALGCFAAAVVLAPSDVRSQGEQARPVDLVETAASPEPKIPALTPRDDAFAPRAEIEDDPPAGITPANPAVLPRLPGAPETQRPQAPDVRVTAIATGSISSAIVEDGGTSHVVAVGDPLEGSVVTAIDHAAVQLANGRRLLLQPEGATR